MDFGSRRTAPFEAGQKSHSVLLRPKQNTKFLFADATSNDYMTEQERFQGQAYEVERENRQRQYLQKQQMLQKKRESRLKEYHDRARKIEDDHNKEIQKLNQRASKWTLGMKNNHSEAYNPITLDYDTTHQGQQLKYKDDMYKYRYGQRLLYLDSRQNSGYNPINGQSRLYRNTPSKPT